ncbi:DUF134 domain-containing protein [Candidatus Dojkabacteria bacterium]|nr:DUF134 domain-containing protein [Candidatus Dojkabacteria bacterium]
MRRRYRRNLGFDFCRRYFKPRGIPLSSLDEVTITDEELETMRLRYVERLNQDEAAKLMKISQSQYQRDLSNTLSKITTALIDGKAIHIEKINKFSGVNSMKVMIPMDSTNKSAKISSVFGRSKYFALYDKESGELSFVENPGSSQARGAGMTAGQFAIDNNVSKVVSGNIGPNAESVLRQGGIEIETLDDPNRSLEDIIKSL